MRTCEIYAVPCKQSFYWTWRHQRADGRVIESEERYPLFYECVSAARAKGYEPELSRGVLKTR